MESGSESARRLGMTAKLTRWVLVAALLTLGSGCVKPDWIQQTLVTVDVTGVWTGSTTRGGGAWTPILDLQLELEQHGAKVDGNFQVLNAALAHYVGAARSGPIEGTVAGDMFTFRQKNGSLNGEMTVSGDEMTGYVNLGSNSRISFRRVSSTVPSSQP